MCSGSIFFISHATPHTQFRSGWYAYHVMEYGVNMPSNRVTSNGRVRLLTATWTILMPTPSLYLTLLIVIRLNNFFDASRARARLLFCYGTNVLARRYLGCGILSICGYLTLLGSLLFFFSFSRKSLQNS